MRKIILAVMLCYSVNASALGYFSRACRLSTVPPSLQAPALTLLYLVGASAADTLTAPFYLLDYEWVLESITVDWGEARYWLFASSAVYWETYYGSELWISRSGPWSSDAWNNSILTDPRVSAYIFNNKLLGYSSRAGAKEIIEVEGRNLPSVHDGNGQISGDYRVQGSHWLYDPELAFLRQISTTLARDCNLTQWGFEWQ